MSESESPDFATFLANLDEADCAVLGAEACVPTRGVPKKTCLRAERRGRMRIEWGRAIALAITIGIVGGSSGWPAAVSSQPAQDVKPESPKRPPPRVRPTPPPRLPQLPRPPPIVDGARPPKRPPSRDVRAPVPPPTSPGT